MDGQLLDPNLRQRIVEEYQNRHPDRRVIDVQVQDGLVYWQHDPWVTVDEIPCLRGTRVYAPIFMMKPVECWDGSARWRPQHWRVGDVRAAYRGTDDVRPGVGDDMIMARDSLFVYRPDEIDGLDEVPLRGHP